VKLNFYTYFVSNLGDYQGLGREAYPRYAMSEETEPKISGELLRASELTYGAMVDSAVLNQGAYNNNTYPRPETPRLYGQDW
jgi:hypothetical protein